MKGSAVRRGPAFPFRRRRGGRRRLHPSVRPAVGLTDRARLALPSARGDQPRRPSRRRWKVFRFVALLRVGGLTSFLCARKYRDVYEYLSSFMSFPFLLSPHWPVPPSLLGRVFSFCVPWHLGTPGLPLGLCPGPGALPSCGSWLVSPRPQPRLSPDPWAFFFSCPPFPSGTEQAFHLDSPKPGPWPLALASLCSPSRPSLYPSVVTCSASHSGQKLGSPPGLRSRTPPPSQSENPLGSTFETRPECTVLTPPPAPLARAPVICRWSVVSGAARLCVGSHQCFSSVWSISVIHSLARVRFLKYKSDQVTPLLKSRSFPIVL